MPYINIITYASLEWYMIAAIAVGVLLVLSLLSVPIALMCIGRLVFKHIFVRTDPEKWGRNESCIAPSQVDMYKAGFAWRDANVDRKMDVHIVNEGYNLYGEYYDFGSDTCVIMLVGRPDSLEYGYFYAIPYAGAGFNILCIDIRAHGLSDGTCISTGAPEGRDNLAWARFVHDELGVKKVLFHGICYGAAGGMYAITDEQCPDYVCGIVADGLYTNLGKSFKNHLIEMKKPVPILYQTIRALVKKHTGHSLDHGPDDVIDRLNKPILMIHSKDDAYSLPHDAQRMFDKCPSKQKMISWHESGKHSFLRNNEPEKYDAAIKEFLEMYIV